ncbi:MAG: glucosamine-6-phosphate deaminase [Bacteroidota bacterium]
MKRFNVDQLNVQVWQSREEIGTSAAKQVAAQVNEMLQVKNEVNIIFAAAPSQSEFLAALLNILDIEWHRINAFHMDEYIGLDADAPQTFGRFLKTRLFDLKSFKSVYYIDPRDPENECSRYAKLLEKCPPDIVCLGIGENGHLAFNDPPVADFNDPKRVKIVMLDEACRRQQVNDGCFRLLDDVPKKAITLTIPTLLSARYLSCVVPGVAKANAVKNTLLSEISTSCPASILRNHSNAMLFLDGQSSNLISKFA